MSEGIPGKEYNKVMRVSLKEHFVPSSSVYVKKIVSAERCSIGCPPSSECYWAFIGSFVGIGAVTYLTFLHGVPVLVASLGASACLIYGVPNVPFAQPRNAIMGHLIAALIGVAIYQCFGTYWYTAALSVSLAVATMVGTRTVHPPAGATALIAVINRQDWLFPLMPVGIGICILVIVGIIINNLALNRKYPNYW
jgi:CBS domain-containing membrane protein